MTMYAWRDAMGASGELEDDDCGYCGAPAFYQDPKWEPIAEDPEWTRETGLCSWCGARVNNTTKEGED